MSKSSERYDFFKFTGFAFLDLVDVVLSLEAQKVAFRKTKISSQPQADFWGNPSFASKDFADGHIGNSGVLSQFIGTKSQWDHKFFLQENSRTF